MVAKSSDGTRNSYMDFLKGIAIIAVIAGHSLSDIRRMDILFNVIYSFHMPLLFFVSAYIEEQNGAKYAGREREMLRKRVGGLLLPYLSWTVIDAALSGNLWETGVEGLVLGLLGYTGNGLWFFPVLFGLKIMHAIYRSVRCKIGRSMIITDILLFGCLEVVVGLFAALTRQPFAVNMLSYAIPYFCAVILVDHDGIQKLMGREWVVAGAMLAYVVVFPHFSFYDTGWMTQVVRIGLSLCVIVICCKMNGSTEQLGKNWFYLAICRCGENSLAIYVLHGFFIDYKGYFNMIDSIFLTGAASIILAFFVAVVCIMIAKFIGISSWCNKLLFGK